MKRWVILKGLLRIRRFYQGEGGLPRRGCTASLVTPVAGHHERITPPVLTFLRGHVHRLLKLFSFSLNLTSLTLRRLQQRRYLFRANAAPATLFVPDHILRSPEKVGACVLPCLKPIQV